MPYIKREERAELLNFSIKQLQTFDLQPGHLNFLISSLVKSQLQQKTSYNKINELIGVLECAKLEAYRRLAAPYEDEKIKENGDLLIMLESPVLPPKTYA